MMYYYWNKNGMRPSVFYNMSQGEKLVVRAFFEYEIEKKEYEAKLDSTQ